MSWKHFKSNQKTLQLVQKAIRDRKLGHAYLLAGESDVKLDVARHLAAALNCERNDGDACGTCGQCRKIFEDRHPDVRMLRPESKSRKIRVEEVRELERSSYLKAGEGRCKIGVIVDADRLQTEAQDAFLKTLEEPPKNTVFLLLTSEPQQLKYTILSRCLRLNLFQQEQPVASERERQLSEALEAWDRPAAAGDLFRSYKLAGELQKVLSQARTEIEERVEEAAKARGTRNLEASQQEKIEDEQIALVEAEYRRQRGHLIRVFQNHFRNRAVESPDDTRYVRACETIEQMNLRFNRNLNEGLVLEISLMQLTDALSGRRQPS